MSSTYDKVKMATLQVLEGEIHNYAPTVQSRIAEMVAGRIVDVLLDSGGVKSLVDQEAYATYDATPKFRCRLCEKRNWPVSNELYLFTNIQDAKAHEVLHRFVVKQERVYLLGKDDYSNSIHVELVNIPSYEMGLEFILAYGTMIQRHRCRSAWGTEKDKKPIDPKTCFQWSHPGWYLVDVNHDDPVALKSVAQYLRDKLAVEAADVARKQHVTFRKKEALEVYLKENEDLR